jgi:MurNAc alpha-1-phosphate uridylyltransferase
MSNNTLDTALIFAAGKGTRMRHLTEKTPKPLIQVQNKTLLKYNIDNLYAAGITRMIINAYYLADNIIKYVDSIRSSYPDIEFFISEETEELETGGGLIQALPLIDRDYFFTVNSDVIFVDNDTTPHIINRMQEQWNPNNMDILMLLHSHNTAIGYDKDHGDFKLDGMDIYRPIDILKLQYVYTGTQIISYSIFDGMDKHKFSLSEIYKSRINPEYNLTGIKAIENDGNWLHVGTPENIKDAEKFLA